MALKRKRTPQEKKAFSLKKDRRNNYAQNDKAARKLIPSFKRDGHRSARRTSAQFLRDGMLDESDTQLKRKLRKRRRKQPDAPLDLWIESRKKRRTNSYRAKKKRLGPPNAIGPDSQLGILTGPPPPGWQLI